MQGVDYGLAGGGRWSARGLLFTGIQKERIKMGGFLGGEEERDGEGEHGHTCGT